MTSLGSTGTESIGDSSAHSASTGASSPSPGAILPSLCDSSLSSFHLMSKFAPLTVGSIFSPIVSEHSLDFGSIIQSGMQVGQQALPSSGSFGRAPTPPPLSEQLIKCPLCLEPFREPKVLACFHSFCKPCLERLADNAEKLICPQCNCETQLCSELRIDSLLNDYGLESVLGRQLSLVDDHNHQSNTNNKPSTVVFGSPSSSLSSPDLSTDGQLQNRSDGIGSPSPVDQNINNQPSCTGCKNGERASAFCRDCAHFLCSNCNLAHQYMHCFDGHRVQELAAMDTRAVGLLATSVGCDRPVKCLLHRPETLRYFCHTCNVVLCGECIVVDHSRGVHNFEPITDVAEKLNHLEMHKMERSVVDAREKQRHLVDMFKTVDSAQERLHLSFSKTQNDIEEAARALVLLVDEQRHQTLKELDAVFSAKQLQLAIVNKKVQQMNDKLAQTIEFTDRLLKNAAPTEVLVFKQLLDARLQSILCFNPDVSNVLGVGCELGFMPTVVVIARQAINGAFGHVKGPPDPFVRPLDNAQAGLPPTPIGRPPSRHQRRPPMASPNTAQAPAMPLTGYGGGFGFGPANPVAFSDSNLLQPKHDFGGSSQSLGGFSPFSEQPLHQIGAPFQYEKWSSGGVEQYTASTNAMLDDGHQRNDGLQSDAQVVELGSRMDAMFPPRSQIKRQKMIYHCKFGEFGVMEGQFTEPSGVTVTAHNEIVVADTNNHRIQVFDKDGRFKFQFGECGKRDGQLLYPNRVAVNRITGDFIVTERSPTHQIQLYNSFGGFVRKFGANILQHPRGVTVDNKGYIIVIECKVMRVVIFDMMGVVLTRFSCSRYLEFPNGVCTNDKQEIFISDNRAHCIKVFNYDGHFVRQLGGEGITNYPIGVGINHLGEVVVADNHNNFNLTVFHQDGTMLSALESKVKHAQCFDVALVDDGSLVLASKDYRLYLYRYMPPQQLLSSVTVHTWEQ